MSGTQTLSSNYVYQAINGTYSITLNLPQTNVNVGDRIYITSDATVTVSIYFGTQGVLVDPLNIAANITITSSGNLIELLCIGILPGTSIDWQPQNISGVWTGNNGHIYMNDYRTLNQLSNVSISSPSSNQVLQYNGTNWVNANSLGTTITSPTNGQILQYNGSTWVNINSPYIQSGIINFNSAGNLTNNYYMSCHGLTSTIFATAAVVLPRACTITTISLTLSGTSTSGNGWTATVFKGSGTIASGSNGFLTVTCLGSTLTATSSNVSVSCSAGDAIAIYISSTGSPTAVTGSCSVLYV